MTHVGSRVEGSFIHILRPLRCFERRLPEKEKENIYVYILKFRRVCC